MKPIHLIGLILIPAFGIVWCFQIWSAGQWKPTLQGDGTGNFYEQKARRAGAHAFVREAFGDSPTPINQATDLSGSSWEDRFGKIIGEWVSAIKSIGHRTGGAPTSVYFTLTYISVRTPSGITGLEAGTQVVCLKDEGSVFLVKAGDLEFEAKRQYLTNDLGVAGLAVRNDVEAQQAVALYIAKQQQVIDHRDEKRKVQPFVQR